MELTYNEVKNCVCSLALAVIIIENEADTFPRDSEPRGGGARGRGGGLLFFLPFAGHTCSSVTDMNRTDLLQFL